MEIRKVIVLTLRTVITFFETVSGLKKCVFNLLQDFLKQTQIARPVYCPVARHPLKLVRICWALSSMSATVATTHVRIRFVMARASVAITSLVRVSWASVCSARSAYAEKYC